MLLQQSLLLTVLASLLAPALVPLPQMRMATEAVDPNEMEIKAALVYKFPRFTTWPDSSFENEGSPFIVGVLGDSAIIAPLEKILAKRKLQGRKVVVRQIDGPEQADQCHLLFVPGDADDIKTLARHLKGKPTLMVGESKGFASRGGHINLYPRGGSVRFEINLKAARSAQLEVSTQLLKLARIVEN